MNQTILDAVDQCFKDLELAGCTGGRHSSYWNVGAYSKPNHKKYYKRRLNKQFRKQGKSTVRLDNDS